jgi:hypothetical protein
MRCVLLVYAEASDSCNTLDFQLGPTGIGTTIPTRQWNIRVQLVFNYVSSYQSKWLKIV